MSGLEAHQIGLDSGKAVGQRTGECESARHQTTSWFCGRYLWCGGDRTFAGPDSETDGGLK